MADKGNVTRVSQLDAGDPRWPLLAMRRLQTYSSIAPMAAVGNVFNALVICFGAAGAVPPAVLAGWFLLLLVVSALRLASARAYLRDPSSVDPGRAIRDIILMALVLGVAWGAMMSWLLTLPTVTPLIPAMVGAGMMSAAASTLSVVPRAAFAFIAPIAAGGVLGFTSLSAGDAAAAIALMLSYCVVLWRSVAVFWSNFVARTLHEYELTEQADTVRLLLHDYQEHSADWLWIVDEQGKLGDVSQRFAEAAQRPVETLAGRDLIDLFEACPEREILRDHIEHMRSFDDLTLPLTLAGEQHWWTLSAHPRLSADRQRVIGLRGVASNVTVERRAEAKVAYMAHYDGLTDLPNRFLFNETLKRSLNRRAAGQMNAVLCLDLDQFKAVNDTLGHPIGDQLLTIVARRLEQCVTDGDMAARLGGDEFAILLSNVDSQQAASMAEKIIRSIADPVVIDGHQIVTGTSIGIAFVPQDGESVSEILKNADLALYDAKANGRNRCSFFASGMDEAARQRRELEMDLRAALGRGELRVHYQPLVNIETNDIEGYEALMRWSHPQRGAVSPADFIPIAEETGLIVQLGEWVLREAVAEVARWPERLHVAVNLSPLQMRSPSLISTVMSALAASGVPANRLELEITESVLMQDSEANIATLHYLRNLGVRISLDDFGTGYSSLNYLRCFPFDKIKIDRCFIESIDTNPDCRAIVASVTSLAKELGMITTAEGVEREAQLAALANGSCTQAQGFLFSRAVPPEELTDLRQRTPVFPENCDVAQYVSKADQAPDRKRRAG